MNKAELAVTEIRGGLKEATLVLKGDLVIRNATEIKTAFIEAQSQYTALNVILQDITRLDISFIQLLIALKKTQGIKLSFQFEESDELNKWFVLAGLNKEFFNP